MDTIISQSPEQTFELGRKISESFCGGEVLALHGDLGAGKTQFAKGIAAGLGYREEVTSPTFTLLHEYTAGRLPVFHFDFYRLMDPMEALQLGLDDYLDGGGVIIIEWAGKFPSLLPCGTRHFVFNIREDGIREISEK